MFLPPSPFVGNYESQFNYSLVTEKHVVEPEAVSYSTSHLTMANSMHISVLFYRNAHLVLRRR